MMNRKSRRLRRDKPLLKKVQGFAIPDAKNDYKMLIMKTNYRYRQIHQCGRAELCLHLQGNPIYGRSGIAVAGT